MKTLTIILLLITSTIAYAQTNEEKTIAVILAAEAGGDGELGMRAVASTMLNRAKQRKSTVYKEATRKNQYYGLTAKNRMKLYAQVKPIADKVAAELVSGKLRDITQGALYFINPKTERPFYWCKIKTVRILNHVFYK